MNSITVAFGAHESSGHSLAWAADVARLLTTQVQVLSVVAPVSAEAPPEFFAELDERRRRRIDEAVTEAGLGDAEVVMLNDRNPLSAIAAHLNEQGSVMCVVGSRDSHEPGGFGEGNPAHHLLHHSHVPVAMVAGNTPSLNGGVFVVGVEAIGEASPALQLASKLAEAAHGSVHAVHAYESLSEDEAERQARGEDLTVNTFDDDAAQEFAAGQAEAGSAAEDAYGDEE